MSSSRNTRSGSSQKRKQQEVSEPTTPSKQIKVEAIDANGIPLPLLKQILESTLREHPEARNIVEHYRATIYASLDHEDVCNILEEMTIRYPSVRARLAAAKKAVAHGGIVPTTPAQPTVTFSTAAARQASHSTDFNSASTAPPAPTAATDSRANPAPAVSSNSKPKPKPAPPAPVIFTGFVNEAMMTVEELSELRPREQFDRTDEACDAIEKACKKIAAKVTRNCHPQTRINAALGVVSLGRVLLEAEGEIGQALRHGTECLLEECLRKIVKHMNVEGKHHLVGELHSLGQALEEEGLDDGISCLAREIDVEVGT